MENANIYNVASDVAALVLNKVLSHEVTLDEALIGILSAPAFIYAETLPKEDFDIILNNAEEISYKLKKALNGSQLSCAELVEGCAIFTRAFYDLSVKPNS